MKTVTLVALFTALAGTTGFLIKVPTAPLQPIVGIIKIGLFLEEETVEYEMLIPSILSPVGWVHLQKLILPLFENVCEDSTNPIIVRLAQEFIIDSSSGLYLKPGIVENLWTLRDGKGLLPKGEIFTEYNIDHMNELKTVYELFYFAKNFDTFYKAAAWARQNVNCGLFVDAIYLAVLNRRDTEKLSVPAPYELLPNYFIPKDVIVKASSLLSGETVIPLETIQNEGNAYILDTNYTSVDFDSEDESKLAYFHEDIGLNTYYFMQKLKKAPWANASTDKTVRYGEYLYHMMKQLSARYNLERYANGFDDVESISWDSFTATPYNPMLIYSNGNDFSQRTTELSNLDEVAILRTIENNVATEVTRMVTAGYNKTEILNHVMEVLVTGDKSYETVLRKALGKDSINNGQPCVLEHYMTTLRDPVFWKINKRIVDIVDDALKIVPTYTREEIYFPGVEIQNIDVKKIMTMFDYFQFDVTDALQSTFANTAFQVKIGQTRLNHKPFVVKLNISSLVTHKGYVKIFLGPKIAPGELATKKDSFVLLDCFEYKFKIGSNVISRSSQEMMNTSEDFALLRTLRKKVEDAEFGLNALPLNPIESITGFPSRLILPKGTPEGLPLQIFALVAPFVKSTISGSIILANTEFNAAILSPGFPFDTDIEDSMLFNLPNAMLKDFIVTHKDTKKPSSEGPGGYKREPFDYTSKKGQYGNNEQYSAKKGTYYKVKQDVDSKNEAVETTTSSNDKLFEKYQINQTEKDKKDEIDDLVKVESVFENPDVYVVDSSNDLIYKPTYDVIENQPEKRTRIPYLKLISSKKREPTFLDYLIGKTEYDDDDEVYV